MTAGQALISLQDYFPPEKFGKDDKVLVPDTNWLFAVEDSHLWSYAVLSRILSLAEAQKMKLKVSIPKMVREEYRHFHENKIPDPITGKPLAPRPLEELIKAPFGNLLIGLDQHDIAMQVWRERPLLYVEAEPAKRPDRADLSVLETAIAIAFQGAEVYVATQDIPGVAGPLKNWEGALRERDLKINVCSPLPCKTDFSEGFFQPKYTITGNTMAKIMQPRNPALGYWNVVFERGVKCGEFDINVGIDAVFKEFFRPARMPESVLKTGKFYMMPAATIKAELVDDEASTIKAIRLVSGIAKAANSTLVTVFGQPLPVRFVTESLVATRFPYRTDLGYLYHFSDSIFAAANYKRPARLGGPAKFL